MASRAATILGVLALAACATPSIRWVPATDYALDIIDNASQQRFDLVLSSKASTTLCLSKEGWPDSTALPAGFDGAVLTTSNGKNGLLPTGSAYCPSGCGEIRIEPGQKVAGTIPYSAFGDTAAILSDDKRMLTFDVHPYRCDN